MLPTPIMPAGDVSIGATVGCQKEEAPQVRGVGVHQGR